MEQINECKEFDEFKGEILALTDALREDAVKFYNKNNKAAGVRLRTGLKRIKTYTQVVIKDALGKKIPKKVKQK